MNKLWEFSIYYDIIQIHRYIFFLKFRIQPRRVNNIFLKKTTYTCRIIVKRETLIILYYYATIMTSILKNNNILIKTQIVEALFKSYIFNLCNNINENVGNKFMIITLSYVFYFSYIFHIFYFIREYILDLCDFSKLLLIKKIDRVFNYFKNLYYLIDVHASIFL
jgi:hypothetical protein